MPLQESTVFITGASRGIGRALALHFATRCRHVVITARSEDGLMKTTELVRESGGSCEFIVADLAEPDSVCALVEEVSNRRISLDVLIHNAADVTSKPFEETSIEEIGALIHTNLIGPLQLTRLLLPHFHLDGLKAIVFISSLAGYKSNPAQTVYSISKGGVNLAARALDGDLGRTGFHVSNLPLSSVALENESRQGAVSVARVCALVEKAIVHQKAELFLSPLSHALMRLYGLMPGFSRPG